MRERTEDVPLLVESFFRKMRLKSDKPINSIAANTMDILMSHNWPGNVRELKGVLEYAFVTCHADSIQPSHLPETIFRKKKSQIATKQPGFNLHEVERLELIEALEKAGGNQSQAALILGISRVTVWNRMKRFNIQSKRNIVARQ